MAGRDNTPNGFGAFKVYVADQLTNPVIQNLTTYFEFSPALDEEVKGNGLAFVNALVDIGTINETDISRLLKALENMKLDGLLSRVQEAFMSFMEVAPQELDMAGRDNTPNAYGLFKVCVSDKLNNRAIRKLTNYFNFPAAFNGDGLDVVNTLLQMGIIKETDISKLLIALNKLDLRGIQEDIKKTFMGLQAQVPSPLKPSPSPGGGEPSKTSTDDDTKPVFISFSFKDLTKVEEIVATFEKALGPQTCWICTTGIKGGQIIDEKIDRALDKAKVVVCIVSQNFIDSNECEKEVMLAEHREKEIIAVHIDSVQHPYQNKDGGASALQLRFARHLYMNMSGEDMEMKMQELIARIKELISQADNQSTTTETKDFQVIPYFCAYCQIIFKESWQHQYHTETEKHKDNINIKKDDEKWAYGEPPLGITDGKFELCPKQSGECSGCSHALYPEELDEWKKRHNYRLEALYNYLQLHSEDMTDQTSKMKTLVEKYEEEKQKDGKHIKNVGNISYLKASDQIIAKGSEGALIYVGKYNDASVAVKRIPIENIQREKELLIKMQDKDLNNVVKIVCIEKDEDFYYVVTPLCECDLRSFIKASSSPSQLQQIKLCLDILSGLMSLHSLNIVHRGLKPRNVLINKKGDALLTDFGISRICIGTSTNVTSVMGSLRWFASECITAATEGGDTLLTKASDIQVAGFLVYYILSNGFHPFDATDSLNALQMQQNITAGKFQLLHLDKFPKECKSLLNDMLDKEIEKRPRIEDCLHKMKEVKTLLILQLNEEIKPSLPGVEVLCGEWSMTKDRKSEQTWSFRVKSRKNLQKVSFRHNDSRELFFFPSPENQQRHKELFAKDLKTDSEGYRCFEVHFQAKEDTGLFDQQVIFDFGKKPFLCQQLLVWIDPKSPTQ